MKTALQVFSFSIFCFVLNRVALPLARVKKQIQAMPFFIDEVTRPAFFESIPKFTQADSRRAEVLSSLSERAALENKKAAKALTQRREGEAKHAAELEERRPALEAGERLQKAHAIRKERILAITEVSERLARDMLQPDHFLMLPCTQRFPLTTRSR